MIKGAVFDVDGTLLDTMGIWEEAGARYLKSIGKVPEKQLGNEMALMTIEEGARYMKSRYELQESIDEIVRGVLGIVADFYFFEACPKPGAAKFLRLLSEKGIPAAAATSSDKELVEAAFQRLGLDIYFQEVLTCSEVGAGKTEPLIYQKAARILGGRPEETYVFEDALYAAQTAHNAGFRTVGIYDKYSRKDKEQLEMTTDIYLTEWTQFDRFWESASADKNRQ